MILEDMCYYKRASWDVNAALLLTLSFIFFYSSSHILVFPDFYAYYISYFHFPVS